MHAVGDLSDRHLIRRPVREERPEQLPADLAMQLAHAVDRATAANRQIGHVEGLRRIVRVLATQGQQILAGDAEPLLGIAAEVLLDERGSKTIEAGRHRRVGGEEVARAGDGQGASKGCPLSAMKPRARSSTAKAAWPSLRWQTSGAMPRAASSRQPPMPRISSCLRRSSGPPP